jgi:uncharacterized protein GlcG (DUF336 family)
MSWGKKRYQKIGARHRGAGRYCAASPAGRVGLWVQQTGAGDHGIEHLETHLNSKRLGASFALALAGIVAQTHSAEPGPAPVSQATPLAPLPLAVALKAVQAALQTCNALGLAPTVTYVDREGIARIVLVSDGAGAVSIPTSRRKAYTAGTMGLTTEQFGQAIAALHVDPNTVDPNLIGLQGGLPIFSKGVLVGGIGVGGAEAPGYPGSGDVRCALAGLAAIKADLE